MNAERTVNILRKALDVRELLEQKVLDTVLEYLELAVRPQLSEAEEERLLKILSHATSNGILNFWIEQVDFIVGHQLNLLNAEHLQEYANQQAKLREYASPDVYRYFLESVMAVKDLPKTISDAKRAQQVVLQCFGYLPEMAGVGIKSGPNGYSVQVYLSSPIHNESGIPDKVLDVPVKFEVVGEVSAY